MKEQIDTEIKKIEAQICALENKITKNHEASVVEECGIPTPTTTTVLSLLVNPEDVIRFLLGLDRFIWVNLERDGQMEKVDLEREVEKVNRLSERWRRRKGDEDQSQREKENPCFCRCESLEPLFGHGCLRRVVPLEVKGWSWRFRFGIRGISDLGLGYGGGYDV